MAGDGTLSSNINVIIAKLTVCVVVCAAGFVVLQRVQNHVRESHLLRSGVIGMTTLKFLACILLYVIAPGRVVYSDAALYYLPETQRLLQGYLPYRDFPTSYSPLFHALLAPGVWCWNSVGSIVLTMLLFEAMTLFLYIKTAETSSHLLRWRVAFIYTTSPISYYWIGMTGYNGAIIQFFTMLSLFFIMKGKDAFTGIFAAIGLLCSKLLAGVVWPALVLVRRPGWAARVMGLAVAPVVLLGFYFAGFDVLLPLKREFGAVTSGNLWFLASTVIPALSTEGAIHWISWIRIVSVLLMIGAVLMPSFRRVSLSPSALLDRAIAAVALSYLVILIVGPKSYPFYLAMTFLFLVHVMSTTDVVRLRRLWPLAGLGVLSILEDYLWMMVRGTDYGLKQPLVLLLVATDLAVIACYLWIAMQCVRILRSK